MVVLALNFVCYQPNNTLHDLPQPSHTLHDPCRGPSDSPPLIWLVGGRVCEAEMDLELADGAEAGLLFLYRRKVYAGVGFTRNHFKTFASAEEQGWMRSPSPGCRLRMRVSKERNIDGRIVTPHGLRMEVSGIHHNVFGGSLGLKLAIDASGSGALT